MRLVEVLRGALLRHSNVHQPGVKALTRMYLCPYPLPCHRNETTNSSLTHSGC